MNYAQLEVTIMLFSENDKIKPTKKIRNSLIKRRNTNTSRQYKEYSKNCAQIAQITGIKKPGKDQVFKKLKA